MEDLLDEQTSNQKQARQPIIIILFLLAIGIRLFGSFLTINSWPFGMELLLLGSLLIFLMGGIAFFTKAFYPPEGDVKVSVYFAFFFIGFAAKFMRYYASNQMLPPILFISNFGFLFELGTVLLLQRYYTRNKKFSLSIDILKWPFFLTVPLMIVGLLFKIQSWPYASEMITLATLLFFIISIISFFRTKYSKKEPIRFLTILNVITANFFGFGFLFKIQSWPYATELLQLSVVFLLLSISLYFLYERKKKDGV